MNSKGFTLVELILVISIIGILAVTAIPQFYDLTSQAKQAAEDGIIAAVRAGINNSYMNRLASGTDSFPVSLENVPEVAGPCVNCFDGVLKNGISDGWTTDGGINYTSPDGTLHHYNAPVGMFN